MGESKRQHLWIATASSLVVHVTAGLVGSQLSLGSGGSAAGLGENMGADLSPLVMLDVPTPAVPQELLKAVEPAEVRADAKPTSDPVLIARAEAPQVSLAQPLDEPEPEMLRLGVDGSKQVTKSWLGFAEPTPHAARKMDTAQPALDPAPGTPGEPTPASTPARETPESREPAEAQPESAPKPVEPVDKHIDEFVNGPLSEPSELPVGPELPKSTNVSEPSKPTLNEPPQTLVPSRLEAPKSDGKPRETSELLQAKPEMVQAKPDMARELPAGPELRLDPAKERVVEALAGLVGPPAPTELSTTLPTEGPALQDSPTGTLGGGAAKTQVRIEPVPEPAAPSVPLAASPLPPLGAPQATRPPAQLRPGETPPEVERVMPEGPIGTPAGGPSTPELRGSPAILANSGGGGQSPGEKSDKQSDATSLEESIEVVLGRPAAAEGLDIVTRRADFTRITRVTARPRNPVVRVTFGRSGRVSIAEIIRSSGYEDVDNPILNALYQWQARGKRLEALDPRNPRAGITVTFTIVFN